VAQAARYLEERGFSTIMLTPMPEFHNLVGIPRAAAIEYPFGRLFGQPGDRKGQREVLLSVLEVLQKAGKPGEIHHLPFEWPEEPKKAEWQPAEMSPIVGVKLEEIKAARKREIEESGKAEE
jgi:hypothetical protein